MAYAAIIEALREVKKENMIVRDALRQRAERLESEATVTNKPGSMKIALEASVGKKD